MYWFTIFKTLIAIIKRVKLKNSKTSLNNKYPCGPLFSLYIRNEHAYCLWHKFGLSGLKLEFNLHSQPFAIVMAHRLGRSKRLPGACERRVMLSENQWARIFTHIFYPYWGQAERSQSLVRIFTGRILGSQACKISSCGWETDQIARRHSFHWAHIITKTCRFKYNENFTTKKWKKIRWKILIFYLFLLKSIDCGYSLEPPRRGGSNEYPQSMLLSRDKKNNIYPCKPQFYCIKVGFKGVKII